MEVIHNAIGTGKKTLVEDIEKTAAFKESAEKVRTVCNKKLQQLVLSYLNQAKDDPFGEKLYFDRFNNEWKVFAQIKNSQQRYVRVKNDAFEENVQFMIELAKKQMEEQITEDDKESDQNEASI